MANTDFHAVNLCDSTIEFNNFLKERTDEIFSLPFFQILSHGLSPEQWPLYAKQFHVTCTSFDKLLKSTVESARKTDHTALIAQLEENLADEKGENPSKTIPHFVLRKIFFQSIGLPKKEMTEKSGRIPILPGTQAHAEETDEIIKSGCVYTQIGAFLAQEFLACGPGFRFLVSGVSKSFPGQERRENNAMKYVYDHIECDGMEHFPHLLKAVDPLMADLDGKKKILVGTKSMLNAEWSLYDSFERDILDLASKVPLPLRRKKRATLSRATTP